MPVPQRTAVLGLVETATGVSCAASRGTAPSMASAPRNGFRCYDNGFRVARRPPLSRYVLTSCGEAAHLLLRKLVYVSQIDR